MFGDVTGLCQRCKLHPARAWFAYGGMMDAIHGGAQAWCTLCMALTQKVHMEEVAARLPEVKETIALFNTRHAFLKLLSAKAARP